MIPTTVQVSSTNIGTPRYLGRHLSAPFTIPTMRTSSSRRVGVSYPTFRGRWTMISLCNEWLDRCKFHLSRQRDMLAWTQRGWLELSVSGCRQQNKHFRLQHNIQQKGVITLMVLAVGLDLCTKELLIGFVCLPECVWTQ